MNKLDVVLKAIDSKLGENVKVIDIEEKTTIADCFVIVTGQSINQTRAIADEIEFKLKKEGIEVLSSEGFRDASWILMDLGDIIVHIFTQQQREFYDLEKLWD